MKIFLAIFIAILSLACVVVVRDSYPNYDYEKELAIIKAMVGRGEFTDAEDRANPILKELKESRASRIDKYYDCMEIVKPKNTCIKHNKMVEYYEALIIRYENALSGK